MGVTELAKQLGISKGLVSMLAKRGMPMTSTDAANAWRAVNAPPRNRKDKREPAPAAAPAAPRPAAQPDRPAQKVSNDTTPQIESANTPELSLKRAIEAEDAAHQKRKEIEMNGGSIEDYRKANGVYIAARNNRVKAQKDYAEWERMEQITIYTSEGLELLQRILTPARQMAEVMPKTMAARLALQPQKVIEKTLFEWSARLIEAMRDEIWPKALSR